MKWFHRKPKTFDYAAIRVGNVYVLPPDEDDVRDFRRKRRKEITRRGFIVAAIGVGLGAIAFPFLPGKRNELRPEMLFSIDPATANPTILKQLCLMFYQHPDVRVRAACADYMSLFPQDAAIKKALWLIIQTDKSPRNQGIAIESLIRHMDPKDIPAIAQYYDTAPAMQKVIDQAVHVMDYEPLRIQIRARTLR